MLNKDSIVDTVAAQTGHSKRVVEDVIDSTLDTVTRQLQKGERVNFSGFGQFMVSERKGRAGVNPRTKAEIQIPPVKVPKFRAGKTLKEAVR